MAETTTTLPSGPPGAPGAPGAPAPDERSPVRSILVIWAVLTVALELFAIFVPARLMGVAASKTMADIKESVTVFSVVAAPVAAVVWAIAIHSLLRWRHRGEHDMSESRTAYRTLV